MHFKLHVGAVQSGKTKGVLATALLAAAHGVVPVIVLQAYISQWQQLSARINAFAAQLNAVIATLDDVMFRFDAVYAGPEGRDCIAGSY